MILNKFVFPQISYYINHSERKTTIKNLQYVKKNKGL